jgi:hypothetical protein
MESSSWDGSWNNLDADFGSWMLDFASLDCSAWIQSRPAAGDGLVAISLKALDKPFRAADFGISIDS